MNDPYIQNMWGIFNKSFDIHLCIQHNISTLLSENCSLRCNQLDSLTTNHLNKFAKNVIVKITLVAAGTLPGYLN